MKNTYTKADGTSCSRIGFMFRSQKMLSNNRFSKKAVETHKVVALIFLALLAFSFTSSSAFAQSRHAETWTFGVNCRVEFEPNGTITSTLDPAIDTFEGCGAFSDPTTGELIIYTDGTNVWQADGTVVVNDLPGNKSAIHSGIVVPRPLTPNRVYAFGHDRDSSTSVGYREFDVSDRANVVAIGAGNLSVSTPNGREGMLVIQHANGVDYWVVVEGHLELYIIPITSSGLGTPQTYATGVPGIDWSVFAASHGGDRIVTAARAGGDLVSFDFDASTGVISNQTVAFQIEDLTYGGSFSADDSKFYYSKVSGTDRGVFQYDFTNGVKTKIFTEVSKFGTGASKLGPDGKMYFATGRNDEAGTDPGPALSVVDFPNLAATDPAFTFSSDSVVLAPGCDVEIGLSQTISPLANIALGIDVTGPNGTIAVTTTTPTGTANLADGVALTITVSDGMGFSQMCAATVLAGAWTCTTPITGLATGVDYTVTATDGSNVNTSVFDVSFCGNGSIDGAEACDDGNMAPGDGCSDSCVIESGFSCPTVGVLCVANVDECANAADNNCDVNATCTDTLTSFTCACNSGYTGDGVTCVMGDVDECATNMDNCDALVTCTNTIGSFTCGACPAGYDDVNNDGTSCVNIDECANAADNNCDANATCTDTMGSFTCACNDGFSGDGEMCTADVGACTTNANNCDALVTCTDIGGGAVMCGACPAGYNDVNADGTSCVNIDECADETDTCDENATCTDTMGSFTCECNTDYIGDGMTCTTTGTASCDDNNCDPLVECTTTATSFVCGECPSGYFDENGDGTSCLNIDECETDMDNCDENATCTDTVASFTCACDTGYTGDGVTCTADDIDIVIDPGTDNSLVLQGGPSACSSTRDSSPTGLWFLMLGLVVVVRRRKRS